MIALAAALAQERPPVVGGAPATGRPEVVLLYYTVPDGSWGATCSGTLVAPDWVLTAAHCIGDSDTFTELWVYVGDDPTTASEVVLADARHAHPDYVGDGYHDVGMVHLSSPLAGADPVAVNKDALRQRQVGDPYEIVGYGSGIREATEAPLYDFDFLLMVTYDAVGGSNACHGDSGGAVFERREDGAVELAGVINAGFSFNGGECEGEGLASARVDAYLDWIGQYTLVYSWEELHPAEPEDTGGDTAADTASDGDSTDTAVPPAGASPREAGVEGCGCAAGGGPSWMLVCWPFALAWRRRPAA